MSELKSKSPLTLATESQSMEFCKHYYPNVPAITYFKADSFPVFYAHVTNTKETGVLYAHVTNRLRRTDTTSKALRFAANQRILTS